MLLRNIGIKDQRDTVKARMAIYIGSTRLLRGEIRVNDFNAARVAIHSPNVKVIRDKNSYAVEITSISFPPTSIFVIQLTKIDQKVLPSYRY